MLRRGMLRVALEDIMDGVGYDGGSGVYAVMGGERDRGRVSNSIKSQQLFTDTLRLYQDNSTTSLPSNSSVPVYDLHLSVQPALYFHDQTLTRVRLRLCAECRTCVCGCDHWYQRIETGFPIMAAVDGFNLRSGSIGVSFLKIHQKFQWLIDTA